MKTDLFSSWGHCWVFQIWWYIECNTFIVSSFRIWNSSSGSPSPPLALFIVMLPKPTWLHIPGCLALGEWSHHPGYLGLRSFLCSSSMYFYHLFLISSASVRSIPFVSFIVSIFAWNVPLVSLIFLTRSLKESLSHLLFSSVSLHWSLRKEQQLSPAVSLMVFWQNFEAVSTGLGREPWSLLKEESPSPLFQLKLQRFLLWPRMDMPSLVTAL